MAGMAEERLEPQPEGEGACGDLSGEEEADLGRAHRGQKLDHAELRVDGESRLSTGGEPGLCERAWKGGQLEGLDPAVDESQTWARDSEGSGLGGLTLAGTPRPAAEAAWPHSEQRGGGWPGDPVSCSSQEPRAPDVGSATQNHGARRGGQEPLQANSSLPVVPQASSCRERLPSSAAHPEGTLAPDARVLQPQVWAPRPGLPGPPPAISSPGDGWVPDRCRTVWS